MNTTFLSWIAKVSQRSGFTALCYRLNAERKRIITYHNIIPDQWWKELPHLGVSTPESIFVAQVRHLQRRFPIDTDLSNTQSLTITFDDGFANQYEVAFMHLQRVRVPAYYFCIAELITERRLPLIDQLLFWVSYADAGRYMLHLDGQEIPLAIEQPQDRFSCWNVIFRLLLSGAVDMRQLHEMLDAFCSFSSLQSRIEPVDYHLRFVPIEMSELATMKREGSLIGAHSQTHQLMEKLTPSGLRAELRVCAALLGSLYNTHVFSYPFGRTDEVSLEAIAATREAGFSHACANCHTPLGEDREYSTFFIPRFSLPNTTDVDVLDFVLSGAKYFIQYRRLLPTWEM
jgi:peptidoglycan/xylan/chitin deacetylase (PgdA/CDA1 family)